MVHLARRLKARGWDVTVISIVPPRAFVEELRGVEVPAVSLGVTHKNPIAILGAFGKTVRILRRWRPDVLHCHMVHANLLGRTVRPFCHSTFLISTVHNICEGGRLREAAYRVTDRLSDLTTFVCAAAAERYLSIGAVSKRRPWLVVPNGVDTSEFRPRAEPRASLRAELGMDGRFVWLSSGRLEEQKAYPYLLHAFSRIVAECPQALLLIAGEGGLRGELEALAGRRELHDTVRFLGMRTDMPQLMSAVDACVMSSDWEGMPMVLLEASAAGLPVVATDVGGNREVVEDGHGGLLVPPRNIDALAGAMRRVTTLPAEELARMGQAGRSRVQQGFDLERIVDRWEGLYRQGLESRGAP